MPIIYQATVPGNLMLMGEHAVLYGKRALAAALNQSMVVELTKRNDSRVRIFSDLGQYETTIDRVMPQPPFTFVLEAIRRVPARLEWGFDLQIRSQFSSTLGLGSSAAVTAGTVAVLNAAMGSAPTLDQLHWHSLEVVRSVQRIGSGADLAASIFGGIVSYRAKPRQIEKMPCTLPIVVLYSGSKTPTTEVISMVSRRSKSFPLLYDHLYDLIDSTVGAAIEAVVQQDMERLGQLMDFNQGLMSALGVSTAELERLVYLLRARQGIFGAKISGSGLGDCVIGLGELAEPIAGESPLPAQITTKGIEIVVKE